MGASTLSEATSARLERLRQRFERWRGRRKSVRARIPAPLWDSAVALAHVCGIHRTSKTLRLEYYSLKKRVEKDLAARRWSVEQLSPIAPLPPQGCAASLAGSRSESLRLIRLNWLCRGKKAE